MEVGAVLHQDATETLSLVTLYLLGHLHGCSIAHPEPLTRQEAQARPHLNTFSREVRYLCTHVFIEQGPCMCGVMDLKCNHCVVIKEVYYSMIPELLE